MGGIPGLEGSNPGKEVPEGRFSPRVRGAPAPGPQVREATDRRSPIINSVLGQASHRIVTNPYGAGVIYMDFVTIRNKMCQCVISFCYNS